MNRMYTPGQLARWEAARIERERLTAPAPIGHDKSMLETPKADPMPYMANLFERACKETQDRITQLLTDQIVTGTAVQVDGQRVDPFSIYREPDGSVRISGYYTTSGPEVWESAELNDPTQWVTPEPTASAPSGASRAADPGAPRGRADAGAPADEWGDWIPHMKGEDCPIPDAKAGEYMVRMDSEREHTPMADAARTAPLAWTQGRVTAYRLKRRPTALDQAIKPDVAPEVR